VTGLSSFNDLWHNFGIVLDTKRKSTLLAMGMLLVTLWAGCTSSGDEEFYRVSKKLLEIDKLWTDVTTYPVVWERETGGDLPWEIDSNTLWRDEELGTLTSYFNSRFPVHGDPALFELISMAVPEELSGIKLVQFILVEKVNIKNGY